MEERRRREREEAEDRRERRMERQLQSQSEMMQMFMLSMMDGRGVVDGRMKRKRDDSNMDATDEGKNEENGREDEEATGKEGNNND